MVGGRFVLPELFQLLKTTRNIHVGKNQLDKIKLEKSSLLKMPLLSQPDKMKLLKTTKSAMTEKNEIVKNNKRWNGSTDKTQLIKTDLIKS